MDTEKLPESIATQWIRAVHLHDSPLPNPHALALILRHYVQSSLHLFDRSSIAKQNRSHRVNVVCNGSPLQILFFAEGAPYTPAGLSILSGHENRQAVKDVVNYFYSDIIDDYLSTYLPEQIKVGQVNTTPNYPTDIPYADMSNNTPNVKAELLAKWTH